MEAVVDVKYRPALFPDGGVASASVAATKKMRSATAPGGGEAGVYRECLRNHAASMGGYAVDGCGEFMPSPAADPADPASLRCAACCCHRSFHRRVPEAPPSPPRLALPPPPPPAPVQAPAPQLLHENRPLRGEEMPEDRLPAAAGEYDSDESYESSDFDENRPLSPLPAPGPPGYLPSATHMLLSLSAGAPGSAPAVLSRPPAPGPSPGTAAPCAAAAAAPKRFRTKFSPEQKQRMQALSERLGWRLQKREEAVVDECCREIGVTKGVFKVWMHNNKHHFLGGHSARRSASASASVAGAVAAHPSSHPAAPPPPAAASAPSPRPHPPVHADLNINGAAHDYFGVLPATASGGSPQSS
ncbi:hypothetical protein ACP70R_047429 [Stipagrostis hirtigluma subsp. patula]